jgi:hypothetical protein
MNVIGELAELLRQLRDADPNFRVFGSKQHRYLLNPPLAEEELATFELSNRIQLPKDYRDFLSQVGNGGAGPFYGLESLGTLGRDLSRPFPFVTAADSLSNEELNRPQNSYEFPGVLEICHQGCCIYSYLVVNGPTYGTLWEGREDFYSTGLTFAAWYRRWLERALRALNNERLVPRWQARPAPSRPIRYFEADDIPAQLELDERDIVIRIRPWPFI